MREDVRGSTEGKTSRGDLVLEFARVHKLKKDAEVTPAKANSETCTLRTESARLRLELDNARADLAETVEAKGFYRGYAQRYQHEVRNALNRPIA